MPVPTVAGDSPLPATALPTPSAEPSGAAVLAAPVSQVAEPPTAAAIEASPYPNAVAGASTAAGRRVIVELRDDIAVLAGLEIAGAYVYRRARVQDGSRDWFHVFDLPRAHVALGAESRHVVGRVLLETVRSAGEGALTGVAGDSLVARAREAYGALRTACPRDEAPAADGACERSLRASGAIGLIQTPTLAELDGTSLMGTIARSAMEREGRSSPSDLGVSARADVARYGYVAAGVFNGEGYTNRELNRGKSGELALSLRPLPYGALAPLSIFGSFSAGSTGTALTRATRWSAALLWQGARVRAGAVLNEVLGVGDDGARRARVVELFGRAELPMRFTFGGRASHEARDARVAADALTSLVGFVGYRPAAMFEIDLVVDHQIPASVTRDAVQGSDRTEVRAVGRFVL